MPIRIVNLVVIVVILALIGISSPLGCRGDTLTVEAEDWASVPELEPVWVLDVQGDTARIVRNEFADSLDQTRRGAFPVGIIRVYERRNQSGDRSESAVGSRERIHEFIWTVDHPPAVGYLSVRPDGTLQDPAVQWGGISPFEGIGNVVARSGLGRVALVSVDSTTSLLDSTGSTITVIPTHVDRAWCFDIPRRVVAVADADSGDAELESRPGRIIILDYAGQVLYDEDCKYGNVFFAAMGKDPDVVYLISTRDYLLRIDEKEVHSLASFPEGRRFSPDWYYVLINRGGKFSFWDAHDTIIPDLLWTMRVDEPMRDLALSDGGAYIAFRSDRGYGDSCCVYVLAGVDGSPVCKLKWACEEPIQGPIAFTGDFLFTGMGFGTGDAGWHTRFVHLYDLSDLRKHR